MSEPQYLTREEAASFLRISLTTLDRWAEEGLIRKHKITGIRSVRYILSELAETVVPVGGTDAE